MNIPFYTFFAGFLLLATGVYAFSHAGLDVPGDVTATSEDGSVGYWFFVVLLYLYVAILYVILRLYEPKHWRVWLGVVVLVLVFLHLARWHAATKYPPLDPDARPAWFEERGIGAD